MHKPIQLPIRVGVIGCGSAAQIIHLPILNEMPEVSVEALCDVDSRKALLIAKRFNISHVFDDIEEMLRSTELDAVFILTPNNMHLPMCLIALEHGMHIFLERPASVSAHQAQTIHDAAKAKNRSIMVGMHTRFRRDLQSIKQVLDRGTLGDVFFIKADWLQAKFQAIKQPWWLSESISGGGVLMDLGLQLIDTSWWLCGKPSLVAANAHVQQINEDLKVEDFCIFDLTFDNNLRISCTASWNFPIKADRFHAEIFGKHGVCELNPFRIEKIWQGRVIDMAPRWQMNGRLLFKSACEDQLAHFVHFLAGRTRLLESSVGDAVEVLKITDALYQSIRKEREIRPGDKT